MMKLKLFLILSLLSTSLISSTWVMAKEITVYDQPLVGAKEVAKVDLSAGIIPIFTQKDGKWIKIADPRNGNVGWVPAEVLNANPHASFVYTQRVYDGKGEGSTQVFQFGNPKALTPEQEKTLQNLQKQQVIQQNVQKNIQDIMQSIGKLYEQTLYPIVMPAGVEPKK